MIAEYNVFTNDTNKTSYRVIIQAILIKLGLSPTSKGTYYLRDIITLAIQDYNYNDIKLNELIIKLASRENIKPDIIKSNIDYTFKVKDTSKSKMNFENIFNIPFDEYYITAKTITNLIVNLIYIQ